MGWPTHTITLEEFGWKAVVFDLSVSDVKSLDAAMKADDPDLRGICVSILPAIKEWNFTDRKGEVLPIDDSSVDALPILVVKGLMEGVLELINRPPFPEEKNTIES